MNKNITALLAGAAGLLLVVVVGVVYSQTRVPVSPTAPGSQEVKTSPTSPSAPAGTENSGSQASVDVSSSVDTLIASAGEEKRVVDGTETDTGVVDENASQISAYGNIYEQSELN